MSTDQASGQPQQTPWNPELTTSRKNLFKFLLKEGDKENKKRKRETTEPPDPVTLTAGELTTVTNVGEQRTDIPSEKETGGRADDAKRRKIGQWEVTSQDTDEATEKVTEYKFENIATGKKKTDYKEGISGGSASGWLRGDLQKRITRSFTGERVNQLLVELSTALFEKVRSTVTTEQEVECLYIGSRQMLLVSSNDSSSTDTLRASILNFKGLTYKARKGMWQAEIVLTSNAIGKLQQENRPQRKIIEAVKKLNEYLAENPSVYKGIEPDAVVQALLDNDDTSPFVNDIYSWMEYRAITERLRKLSDDKVVSVSPAEAAVLLADMTEGVIVVKNTLEPLHAELTLLYTYLKSGRDDEVAVYGRKRPCQGCYYTLAYVKELGWPIKFNPNPGKWFEGNVSAAIAYYGGLKSPENLTILHKHFKALGDDEKQKIVQWYALRTDSAYGTMVQVTDKTSGELKWQEARGMGTPPGSPNPSPDDPNEITSVNQFNELMEMDKTTD